MSMFFMRKSMERGVEGDFQLDGVGQKYLQDFLL